MTNSPRILAVCAVAAAWLAPLAVPAAAQQPSPLFSPAPPPSAELIRELSQPQVARLAFGAPHLELLEGPDAPAGADAIVLNLFDDVRLIAVRDRFERRGRGRFTWFGRLADDRQSSVILVVRDGNLTGFVQGAVGVFDVVALDGDTPSAIREIDQSGYGPEEPPDQPGGPAGDGGPGRGPASMAPAAVCSDQDFIDVMVVYTAEADAAVGDILGEIQAGIDDANEAYANSGIVQRLRLVHAEQVDYAESGDSVLDRDRLQDPSDGFMDGVHALRDTYGADLVSLWTRTGDWCGYSFVMGTVAVSFEDHGFNAVTLGCAVGNHTFVHELAHNMGARHDRYVDGTDGSPYDYNHGFVNIADAWRTIMAYNDACEDAGTSCTRLQFFSNPDLTYGGDPMGIPDGEPDAADNRTTLNNTRTTVQQFRAAHAPIADAGPDSIAECGVATSLDGSASCDPDGDPLVWSWTGGFEEGGGTAAGVSPAVTFPKGVHEVSLVVSDGLIASFPDTVMVDATADLTAPTIACPADVVVSCTEPTDPPATGTATAGDLCDASPSIDHTDSVEAGACPQERTIERTWTATDDDGNVGSCVQTVTVDDSSAPILTCGTSIDSLWPVNHKWRDIGFSYQASDDCDTDVDVSITVTSDEHPSLEEGSGGPEHCPDAAVDPRTGRVLLRAERAGTGDGRVYVVKVRATDACGNASTCEAVVTVPKSQGRNGAAVDSGQAFDATTCSGELEAGGAGGGRTDVPPARRGGSRARSKAQTHERARPASHR